MYFDKVFDGERIEFSYQNRILSVTNKTRREGVDMVIAPQFVVRELRKLRETGMTLPDAMIAEVAAKLAA